VRRLKIPARSKTQAIQAMNNEIGEMSDICQPAAC
jgi:hypothetical protein